MLQGLGACAGVLVGMEDRGSVGGWSGEWAGTPDACVLGTVLGTAGLILVRGTLPSWGDGLTQEVRRQLFHREGEQKGRMVRSLVWGVGAEGGVRGFQQAGGTQAHCRRGSGLRVPETAQRPRVSEEGALRAWRLGIGISLGK